MFPVRGSEHNAVRLVQVFGHNLFFIGQTQLVDEGENIIGVVSPWMELDSVDAQIRRHSETVSLFSTHVLVSRYQYQTRHLCKKLPTPRISGFQP